MNDDFIRWLNQQRKEEHQEALQSALHDFDPDWKMLSGDHLSDYDYEFLQSCNVSWEYNNEEGR